MKIKKVNDTYNTYQVEMSYGQLLALKNGLAAEHADPVADEAFAELSWYLDNIPGPGESEEDLKKAEEAEASGMASPEAAGQPLKPSADDLLPMPGGEEEGPAPEGEENFEAPPEGLEGEEGPAPEGEEMPPQEEEASEADRRLPPPPEE